MTDTTKDSIDVLTPDEWQRWATAEIVRLRYLIRIAASGDPTHADWLEAMEACRSE